MTGSPTIHYARRSEHHLAYTVTGDGPIELVYLLGFVSHLDLLWEEPSAAKFLDRLGRFCRLVVIDKRGTGLSDRTGDVPIPEEQVDDLAAVIEDVGLERPALLGTQDGFLVAALLAATAPERVRALIGISTGAAGPEQWPRAELERFFHGLEKYWGREDAPFNYWARHVWDRDPAFRRWWARYSRSAAGPATAVKVVRNYTETDIRLILPSITVPTLIAHPRERSVNHLFAQQLADGITGARFVELTSRSTALLPWIEGGDEVASLVEEFLTGTPVPVVPDRVLATVLFTDVVESTQQAAALGDLRWSEVLDRHDAIVQSAIRRFRGRWIKATGDGVLATFDGPARAVHCAEAIRDDLAATGIRIRGGVHTGEIELRGDDVGGLGVHIAARIVTHAQPNEVVVSRTVKELAVGSGIDFRPLGALELKGVPDRWELFAASSPASG